MSKPNPLGFETVSSALNAHSSKAAKGKSDLLDLAIAYGDETDRGAVILASTSFEDKLKDQLLKRFKPLNSRDRANLFDFGAPLGTFSAKIRMAHALGMLDAPKKRAAEMVRVMRNACAHSGQSISFADKALMDGLYYVTQEFGHDGDALRLNEKDRPDWPRFIFLLLVGELEFAIRKRKPKNRPFGSDLFDTYLTYRAVLEEERHEGLPKLASQAARRVRKTLRHLPPRQS